MVSAAVEAVTDELKKLQVDQGRKGSPRSRRSRRTAQDDRQPDRRGDGKIKDRVISQSKSPDTVWTSRACSSTAATLRALFRDRPERMEVVLGDALVPGCEEDRVMKDMLPYRAGRAPGKPFLIIAEDEVEALATLVVNSCVAPAHLRRRRGRRCCKGDLEDITLPVARRSRGFRHQLEASSGPEPRQEGDRRPGQLNDRRRCQQVQGDRGAHQTVRADRGTKSV